MILEKKRILVTGGAGFIGSHLVDALIRENCFVRVIDNLSNGKLENLSQYKNSRNLDFIQGDITDIRVLNKVMKDIDIVLHLACLGVRHSIKYPLENHHVNAEGTILVLEESRKANIKKFIYFSSSEVYGTAEYVPMPETHPTRPHTVYGSSKLVGESYARAYHKTHGLKTVIIRLFNAYGPRSHHESDAGELIPRSIVRVLNGKPILIFGDGSQTRDYTYIEDVVRGILMVLKSENLIGLTLNMGSGFEISVKQVSEMISKMVDVQPPRIEYIKNRPGDVLRLCADAALFKRLTHWEPEFSLEQGLLKTIAWFKAGPDISMLFKKEVAVNWE